MLAAVAQMALRRTTVIPRRDPSALVTGGVYAISRNPIYLADALILAGVVLWADVPLAAPLVPAFMALIQRRFIRGEEARIAAAFGADFAAYAVRTPRWLGWPRGGNGD
jgi:protein-S-isoprenylcysteine O-methyltransferase Ste14